MKQIHALKATAAVATVVLAASAGAGTAIAAATAGHARPAVTKTATVSTVGTGTSTTTTTTAAPITVTVRVEGLKKTLLAAKQVTLKAGWVVKGGDGSGTCPNQSAQGALNAATNGSWAGTWSTSYGPQWMLTKILGESDNYTTTSSWWELFTGHLSASTGACETTARSGEVFTFAAVGATETPGDLTAVSVPVRAKRGKSFTVKVDYFRALTVKKGSKYSVISKELPLAGATVTIAGKTYVTGKAGTVKVTVKRTGTFKLTDSRTGYIRDESTVKVVK